MSVSYFQKGFSARAAVLSWLFATGTLGFNPRLHQKRRVLSGLATRDSEQEDDYFPVDNSAMGVQANRENGSDAEESSDDEVVTSTAASHFMSPEASDADFREWLVNEVSAAPGFSVYSRAFEGAVSAALEWRRRFRGNPGLWRRIFKKGRFVKELTETAPIIDAVLNLVESTTLADGEQFTIVDLCCGKGFLSMTLSELLDPRKVERCVLVDKAWPRSGSSLEVLPHQMNWEHIYGHHFDTDGARVGYFESWPIRLVTSKQDLKKGSTRRALKGAIFAKASGPVLVLAVHLCGTLSLRAAEMFNDHENVKMMVLKPCCLPSIIHSQREEIFQLGTHSFLASEVCSNGRFKNKKWSGPPRWHLEQRFERWAENLELGVGAEGIKTSNSRIVVQVKGGFQNRYIWAERPIHTEALWDCLAQRQFEALAAENQAAEGQIGTGAFDAKPVEVPADGESRESTNMGPLRPRTMPSL